MKPGSTGAGERALTMKRYSPPATPTMYQKTPPSQDSHSTSVSQAPSIHSAHSTLTPPITRQPPKLQIKWTTESEPGSSSTTSPLMPPQRSRHHIQWESSSDSGFHSIPNTIELPTLQTPSPTPTTIQPTPTPITTQQTLHHYFNAHAHPPTQIPISASTQR